MDRNMDLNPWIEILNLNTWIEILNKFLFVRNRLDSTEHKSEVKHMPHNDKNLFKLISLSVLPCDMLSHPKLFI
jgi:hypothetical protein